MPFLLDRMIADAASHRSDAVAVRCDGESLSYGQLFRRSNGLARVLVDAGVRPRDRVAVLLGKGLEVPVAHYGVFAAGGVLVPIDPVSPADQVARILRRSGAVCLITEPKRNDRVEPAMADAPDVKIVVGLEPPDDAFDTTTTGESVNVIPWERVDAAGCDRPPDVHLVELDPAYILHTSGSTGTPKLILHTHRSAMSFLEWAVAEYALTAGDRLGNHSSHHTCFATFDYYAAALAGATTVILPPAELKLPASLSALLERERVTVWYSVPTALVQLSLRGALEARDLRSMRWVLFAGETFPPKHLRRIMEQLPGARFSHVYGSTEVNVCTYHHLRDAADLDGGLPIGRACSTSCTRIVDDELRRVPAGGTGELLVRGATVMQGYWGDPERSRRALVRLPIAPGVDGVWFRTGDRVQKRNDGNLIFVTRSDFQVKVRGHRVELEEVEAALLSLESVEEAAAFASPDDEGSSQISAVIVARDAVSPDDGTLLAGLRRLLPVHALPARIERVSALPRTPTGKVDRAALLERIAGGTRNRVS